MSYLSVNKEHQEEMLKTVGVENISDLFVDIPRAACLNKDLDVEGGLSEIELLNRLNLISAKNVSTENLVSFIGAGVYDHFQPAFIDQLLLKPEFFTAYTPYQPEVSQGTLQAMYEFQTGICELTGMDIANASMYDGATAMVEAGLMALRLKKKKDKLLVLSTLHPEYLETLASYAEPGIIRYDLVSHKSGITDMDEYAAKLDDNTAAVVLGYPNFYGSIEDLSKQIALAKEVGALVIIVANPTMLSVLESPGALGADIAVGEAQGLGIGLNYGGPGLGYFACCSAHMRQMPGRIAGRTKDVDGNIGYVLTLSTREQHIRREKATSNICSNHALMALAAGAYLANVGEKGLRQVAINSISLAHYLADKLIATGRFERLNDAPFTLEFALKYKGDVGAFMREMETRGYLAGYLIDDDCILFAVTEKRTKEEVDNFVEEVAHYVG